MEVVIGLFAFICFIMIVCRLGDIVTLQQKIHEELKEIKIRTGRF